MKMFWAMRFESKHQYFKQLIRVVGQFKNFAYTFAYRHQVRSCVIFQNPKSLVRPTDIISTTLGDFMNYAELLCLQTYFHDSISFSDECLHASGIDAQFHFSTSKNQRMALIYGVEGPESDPQISILTRIIFIWGGWYLLSFPIEAVNFPHLCAYQLGQRSAVPKLLFLSFPYPHPPVTVHFIRCNQCVLLSTFFP
jgi:hypothetical protein